MTLFFFFLFVVSVGALFFWVLEQMVFKGKWFYFIYFLAAYLPFYITSLSVIFLVTGSPELVKLFQILKELVVLISFGVFLVYHRSILDIPIRMQKTDWLLLGFLGLTTFFLVLPLGGASFTNKVLYYKSILIPGLVYFLGRNTQMTEREINRFFMILFAVAVGAFFVNIIENFGLNAHLQQFSGYSLYHREINDLEPSGNFGLTWTFETQSVTKRLASFFADPLELASSILMGFAAGLIWFLTSRREFNWFYLLVMLCSAGSLIFAASRAAFVAFFVMIFFVALVFRLYKLILGGGLVVLLFAFYVLFLASDDLYYFVLDTITFQNSSSMGHVLEWALALDSMISNPLGIGLAMSGNFGSVTDELRVGGENQFLIYGVQLGWIGMLLYILLLAYSIRYCIYVFYHSPDKSIARIAFVGGVVKFGLVLPLFTANVEIYTYVSWLTWWMVGMGVQAYSSLKNQPIKHDSASELSSL